MKLTPQHIAVIRALARYRYLTNRQLEMVTKAPYNSIRRVTALLARTPSRKSVLDVQRFPVHARLGRIEHVYRLGSHGQEIAQGLGMMREEDAVGASVYALDFFHRKAVISFRILLDQALATLPKYRVTRYETYFEKTGANHRNQDGPRLSARTRVTFPDNRFFIPDSIFILFKAPSGQRSLFALEYVRGNKTARTVRQVQKHMAAMETGVVTQRYGITPGQDYVGLFLFENEALRDRVLRELSNRSMFAPFQKHFLFAAWQDVEYHILGCWRQVGDEDYLYDFIEGARSFRLPEA